MFSLWSNIISRLEEFFVFTTSNSYIFLYCFFILFQIFLWIFFLIWIFFIDVKFGWNFFKNTRIFKKCRRLAIKLMESLEDLEDFMLTLTDKVNFNLKKNILKLNNEFTNSNYLSPENQKIRNEFRRDFKNLNILLNESNDLLFFAKVRIKLNSSFDSLNIHPFFNLFRTYYRYSITTLGGFIKQSSSTLNYSYQIWKNSYMAGLKSIWYGLRFWIIPLFFSLQAFYFLTSSKCLPILKVMFVWIVVGMFSYWLLSGFVFFIKKYQFSKFTSSIQRFWRRSYILFWLIEFSLFSVFFYLTLNANNESWYMYDQLQVFKTGLFSWRFFFEKIFPLTLLIIFGYLLMLSLKWNIFTKHILWLLTLTILLIYIVWLEFYQFFHAVNFYGNFNWVFDIDEKVWSLELETRKSRTVNHYIMLMIMLKFWHIVVIFVIWVFFLLRSLEIGRVRYPLLSANLQNFIILYLFAWVLMFPWIKFIFRKYLDMPYYWFYVNNRKLGYRTFFADISSYYYAFSNFIYFFYFDFKEFFYFDFFYFPEEDEFYSFRKSFSKNFLLSRLTS